MRFKTSPQGVQFTVGFEGIVTKAYLDPAGVLTIGLGFTMRSRVFAAYWRALYGRDLRLGDTISKAEALRILPMIMDEEYGAAVNNAGVASKQTDYDGATDMTFNCGPGALKWKWAQALKAGNRSLAAKHLRTTAVTANGRKLPGLVRRRKAEAYLIEHGEYHMSSVPEGKSGAEVRWYQEALATLGYLRPEDVDGIAGKNTRAAVREFQEDKGLVVDGIVGQATRAALVRALDTRLASRATTTVAGASGGGAAATDAALSPPAGGMEGLDQAFADVNWLLVLAVIVGAAVAIRLAFWFWQNRGRFTGRRVPT